MKFFTADLHLGHKNVISYCDRPFQNLHEMNKALINNWNSRVSCDDTVYVLGDFAFMGVRAMSIYINELKGKKILIRGNHDGSINRMMHAGFNEVHRELIIKIGEHDVLLNHFPYFNKETLAIDEIKHRPVDNGKFLLHGHTHKKEKMSGRQCNVGVDSWNFYPASEMEVLALLNGVEAPVGITGTSDST